MKTFKQYKETLAGQDQEFDANNNGIENALKALSAVKDMVKSDPDTYVAVMKALAALQGFQGQTAPFTANQPLNQGNDTSVPTNWAKGSATPWK